LGDGAVLGEFDVLLVLARRLRFGLFQFLFESINARLSNTN
jgi:hypothetical protein